MKKQIIKISACALAAAAGILLSGCQAGNHTSAKSGNPAGKAGETTVTAWAWGPNVNIPALTLAGAAYQKEHPGISLQVLEMGQSDVVQKMNAVLGSGSTKGLPNIVLVEDYRAATFLQAYPHAFVPLQQAVDMSQFLRYKQFLKGPEGEQYGLPFDIGTSVLYYRKDIIEKAGYTEADMQDLTWNRYMDMAKTVSKKTGVKMLAMDPADLTLIRSILQSEGIWYEDQAGGWENLDNAQMKKALTINTDLLKSDYVKIVSEWSQFIGSANNGDVATVPQGCWFTGNIMKEASQSGEWRVAPMPHLDGVKACGSTGGSSWYVLNGVPGESTALDLLASTLGSSTKLYEDYMKETGTTTSFLPVKSTEIYEKGNDFFGGQKIYSDFMTWANTVPTVNYGASTYQAEDILKVAVQDILSGSTVDGALKKAQQQADSQIR